MTMRLAVTAVLFLGLHTAAIATAAAPPADGKEIVRVEDGVKVVELNHADGTKTVTRYNADGKTRAAEKSFDKDGKLVCDKNYGNSGKLLFETLHQADGSTVKNVYNPATGKLFMKSYSSQRGDTSETIYNPDGTPWMTKSTSSCLPGLIQVTQTLPDGRKVSTMFRGTGKSSTIFRKDGTVEYSQDWSLDKLTGRFNLESVEHYVRSGKRIIRVKGGQVVSVEYHKFTKTGMKLDRTETPANLSEPVNQDWLKDLSPTLENLKPVK